MTEYQADAARSFAGRGYGWEDICVMLNIRWDADRKLIRRMVLNRGGWRGVREAAMHPS